MYARVTLLEIDTVRMDVEAAVELFKTEVLPRLREQDDFEGVCVLGTPEGKGLLISLWASEAAAEATADTGLYSELLAEYLTLFRSPPGRERYEVFLAEAPALAIG